MFDGEHVPLATLPGHARPHGHHLVGRQDVLVHGLEDRLGLRARPSSSPRCKTVKQFLTYVNGGPFQYGIAVGLGLPGVDVPPARGRRCEEKRDRLSRRARRRRAHRVAVGRHLLRHHRHPLARRDRRPRVLPRRCPSAAAWSRCRASCSTTTRTPGVPLVRFAFCKRLDVIDEAASRLKGLAPVRVAAHPARHRVGGPRRELRAPRADDRATPRGDGARLVVLTEMYSTGFSMDTERDRRAVRRSERAVPRRAGARARRLGVRLGARGAAGRRRCPSNTLVLAAPDGAVHRYRKIHPFTYGGEHEQYAAGDERVTVDVEGVRCSFFVCYDLRFADEFWALAPDTDCYVVVANWPAPRRDHWRTLLRARAIENQAYVVGVNRVGSGGRLDYAGDSADRAAVRRDAGGRRPRPRRPSCATSIPTVVAETRARYPFLTDRR